MATSSFRPYRRRRHDAPVPQPAAAPASDEPKRVGNGWNGPMGWTGDSRPVGVTKPAVELCSIPEQPIDRYASNWIGYGDDIVGRIYPAKGRWLVDLGGHTYGPFRTYLGAYKFSYNYFAGLDIIPWDDDGPAKP